MLRAKFHGIDQLDLRRTGSLGVQSGGHHQRPDLPTRLPRLVRSVQLPTRTRAMHAGYRLPGGAALLRAVRRGDGNGLRLFRMRDRRRLR